MSTDPHSNAKIDKTSLGYAARGRQTKTRITETDQAPSLKVVMDRRRQFSTSFIQQQIGAFDPDSISFDQMRLMKRDPMIAFALHFVKAILVNADWHIEGPDNRVNAFVDAALRKVYASLLRQMLTALEFGFAPIVPRFGLEDVKWTYTDATGTTQWVWDQKVGVKALVWKQPRLLPVLGTEPIFAEDEETFAGIRANLTTRKTDDNKPLETDANHSLWFTNELDESRGDLYGYPRTGYAFKYWWSSAYRHLLEDRHFEQDADPPLVIRVPKGKSPHPETGELVDNREIGLFAGAALRDGATVVMDSQVYIDDTTGRPTGVPMWDAKFLVGGENLQAFRLSNVELNTMKLRSVFVPEEALIRPQNVGSRASAQAYGAAFIASQSLVMDDVDSVLNEHYIPKLVNQNFVKPPWCKKVTTGFKDEDISLASDLLKILVSQAPNYAAIDWRKVVASTGLPILSREEQKALLEELGPIPAAGANADTGAGGGGDTGGVGGAPQPNVSKRTLLAAALGSKKAQELLNLQREEGELAERIEDLFERADAVQDGDDSGEPILVAEP